MTYPLAEAGFSGQRASRNEMCRLAGRHFEHSIAAPCPVNRRPEDTDSPTQISRKGRF
jgi:hypothetical protein